MQLPTSAHATSLGPEPCSATPNAHSPRRRLRNGGRGKERAARGEPKPRSNVLIANAAINA
eukprot:4653712-Lingulodinium_polyedra.AAC.1